MDEVVELIEDMLDGERIRDHCLFIHTYEGKRPHCTSTFAKIIVRGSSGTYYRLCTNPKHIKLMKSLYPNENKISEEVSLWTNGKRINSGK